MFAGIDYGNQMAGTTVIAALMDGHLKFFQSEKKKSADAFILNWVKSYSPQAIFLDAPLSIPKAFFHPRPDANFFYREADQVLNAMSPMFLGGLTARAISLKSKLSAQDIQVIEVYPRQMARILGLEPLGYKKKQDALKACWEKLAAFLPYPIEKPALSWHHLDAALAFCSGWRFENKRHQSFGDPQEGVIIV